MNFDLKKFNHSPIGSVARVAAVILVSEFLIMYFIELVFNSNPVSIAGSNSHWKFIDPVLLTVIVVPSLYFLVLRPMRRQHLNIEEKKIQLKESEENLNSLLNQLIAGVVQSDISGCILYVNDHYCEMLGYSREDLLGKKWQSLTHPDDLQRNEKLFNTSIHKHEPYLLEKRYIRKDGSNIWVNMGASLRHNIRGEVIGSTCIVVDISERKVLEKELLSRRNELEQLQKMHVAAQTASAIAHEMNQPLLAIASYSNAARKMLKAENRDLEDIGDAIEKCEQQALRAGKSIREILKFLQRTEFVAESFDINQEIVNIVDSAKSDYSYKFISVLKLEEGLPQVRANRTHIQKVLLNLLHNSVEATQFAPAKISNFTVTLSTANYKNNALVTIRDNGTGIEKENTTRLFEPFFTTKVGGIGMGLAVSRSLIEENGGELWFEPQEDNGATFHLTLPFAI